MKKLYIVMLISSIYQLTKTEPELNPTKNIYRQEFDRKLTEKRKIEDLQNKNNNEERLRLAKQREIEDFALKYQRAKEDSDEKSLTDLRKQENTNKTKKREEEDKEWFSSLKNWWSRDRQRKQEDSDIRDKRKREDEDLTKQKTEVIRIEDITPESIQQIHTTGHAIDLLLVNQEFKGIMSKLVDIENYQKVYHDLATGTVDITSLQRVQNSLKTDIKFSPKDLEILKKHEKDIVQILTHINKLFDMNNPIYKKVEETLQKQQPHLTVKDLTPLLNKSITELQNINFGICSNFKQNKAWYIVKETVIALVATPFVTAGAGMFAGKTVGLWAGGIAGGIAGAPAAGIGAIPGALVGGAVGDIAGAALGTLAGLYVGIKAAPFVAAARFGEALKNYEYTIKRDSGKYEHKSGEYQEPTLSPDAIWKKLTPDDPLKHEALFFGGILGAAGRIIN